MRFRTQEGILTDNDVLRFCIANSYKFDIAGLFDTTSKLSHTAYFSLEIESIAISFRLFTKTPYGLISIQINNKLVFRKPLKGAAVP